MADSKKLTTLKALTDYLAAEVSIANGYKHTLANAVFRGRMQFGDTDPLPMVSILENIDPDRFPRRAGAADDAAPLQKEEWVLLITGYTEDDKLNPTDTAYELLADVKKALAKLIKDAHPMTAEQRHASYMLGGLIGGMTMEPGTVRPPQEQVSTRAFFYMRAILKFVEDLNDPYKLD